MKVFLNDTVLEAARARMRWVYDRFETVYVSSSGGKDSTVILNLALEEATRRGRLPVPVVFLDQEAEWQSVVTYMRAVMDDPRVSPRWLQVPFKLFNATSTTTPWLSCWDPEKQADWMRPKEPDAITENVYGTDRFHKMFGAFIRHHHPSGPACYVAGVRCEESAARMMGLTQYEAYQGETWGVRLTPKQDHFTFYPIYDWGLSDVWKAIHDHNWPYCGLYDVMYQYGVPVIQMRVSNLHHETAVRSLFYCQEVEPQTWEKLQARLAGVHSAGQMGQDWYGPVAVPPMFANAVEYRDYLLAHLIADPAQRAKYAKSFAAYDARYGDDAEMLAALRLTQIGVILVNDTEGTKLTSFRAHAFMKKARKQRRLAANGEPS